jgi:hypothetical protein
MMSELKHCAKCGKPMGTKNATRYSKMSHLYLYHKVKSTSALRTSLFQMRWVMSDKTKEVLINILVCIWVTYTAVSMFAFLIFIPNYNYYKDDAKFIREVCGEYRQQMDNWDKDQREIPEWLILEFYKMDAWTYELEVVIIGYDKWDAFGDLLRGGKIEDDEVDND